jgi:UDPglucose 6-dehydrogenase
MAEMMAGDAVVDTRNLLDPRAILDVGLSWQGIGRPVRRSLSRESALS